MALQMRFYARVLRMRLGTEKLSSNASFDILALLFFALLRKIQLAKRNMRVKRYIAFARVRFVFGRH